MWPLTASINPTCPLLLGSSPSPMAAGSFAPGWLGGSGFGDGGRFLVAGPGSPEPDNRHRLFASPPIRLKRFPFWASFCILAVRGAVVNLGLFLHFSDQLGATPDHSARDLDSNRLYLDIQHRLLPCLRTSLTSKEIVVTGSAPFRSSWGSVGVFNLARGILTVCYVGVIVVAPWLQQVNQVFLSCQPCRHTALVSG